MNELASESRDQAGPQQPPLWPCPRCQKQIPSTSVFCPNCGLQLAANQPPPNQPPPAAAQKSNPLVGFFVLIVVGFAVWYLFLRSPAAPSSPTSPGAQRTSAPAAATAAPAAFADVNLSGRGNDVERLSIPGTAPTIMSLRHSGSSNFIVAALNASGGTVGLLVNEIGTYSGTVLAPAGTAALEIDADGFWNVTVQHVTKARPWNPSANLTGRGDDVVRVVPPPSGLTTISLSHTGSSNFIVTAYTDTMPALLVNEIGRFTGRERLPAGTLLMTFQADGPWTVSPD